MVDEGLRLPDPTLTRVMKDGKCPIVYYSNGGVDVIVFHRINQDEVAACGQVASNVLLGAMNIKHARYIGVPCREEGCFPDAPEPGKREFHAADTKPVTWGHSADPNLAWQLKVNRE